MYCDLNCMLDTGAKALDRLHLIHSCCASCHKTHGSKIKGQVQVVALLHDHAHLTEGASEVARIVCVHHVLVVVQIPPIL